MKPTFLFEHGSPRPVRKALVIIGAFISVGYSEISFAQSLKVAEVIQTPPAALPVAQETLSAGEPRNHRLGLREAFVLALSTHPSVAAKFSQQEAARMRLETAEWGRYPSLSMQSGSNQNGRYTTMRVEQPLWTGGQITGQIDSATAGIGSAGASITEAQQDIMGRVAMSFTELGRVNARKLAAKSNVVEHERLVSLIGRRVDNEVSPTSDRILAEARLSQARSELSQLESLESRARSALAQAISREVGEIQLPRRERLNVLSQSMATEAALDFSPALRRLDAEAEAATAEIAIRKGATMPRVVARYDRTFAASSLLQTDQLFVGVDYQPGAGMSSLSAVREAEAKREAARLNREAAKRDILDAITADWGDLQSLDAQAQDLRAQVNSTTEVFESFIRQYAVGRKSWQDVLNAQREATQARYALADAEWGGLRSALRIQLATGQLTATTLSTPPQQ